MLDQLVESRDTSKESKRKRGFLLTIFLLAVCLMLGGWVFSLFGKSYGVTDDLELSSLVAPVPIAEEDPPPPDPEPEKKVAQAKQEDQTVRRENIVALDESPPDKPPPISTEKSTSKERPKGSFTVDPNATNETTRNTGGAERGNDSGNGGGITQAPKPEPKEPEPKPAAPPPPPPPPPAPPKAISKGVINGEAISLPKPPYPPAARAVRASGAVNVQVKISASGSVVSANAVSGTGSAAFRRRTSRPRSAVQTDTAFRSAGRGNGHHCL